MDWEAIVKRGVESDELDYKAAQNWNRLSRTGRAKFARHCMAMANTKGGFIVVGVGEDASGKHALLTLRKSAVLSTVLRIPRWNSPWNVRWWTGGST